MRIKTFNRPAKPKEAILLSVTAIFLGIIGAFIAYYFYFVPIAQVVLVTLGIVYISVSISWAYLDIHTRNLAIKGHNMFVYFTISMIIVAFFITKEGEPFPKWQIYTMIIVGIICYSFAGFAAVKNFIRWRNGEFQESIVVDNELSSAPGAGDD